MKNENGITLIALIITIIVMLILVGVTINVALNGGLFDKAKNASEQTQKQVEKEELITIAIGAYSSKNNSVTLSELTGAISTEKYEYDSGKSNENVYVIKGKKSGTIWQIDLKTAEVKEYEEPALGGDDTPTPEPVTTIDNNTTYDIYFKDYGVDFDWTSITLGGAAAFYPSNKTIDDAIARKSYFITIF